jgi:hypothetical protein
MIKSNLLKLENRDIDISSLKNLNLESLGLTKEQILLNNLKHITKEYIELEKIKNSFCNIVQKNLKDLNFSELTHYPRFHIKENYLKKQVSASCINGLNFVSVDGSSVSKSFMNVDFSFLKAIAVKYFFYKKGSKAKIDYYPDLNGFNYYSVQGDYINREFNLVQHKVSMDMTLMEINLLNKLIERSNDIDLIIVDGSIVPTPINLIFSQDLEISKKYDNLLKEYQKLYSNCEEKNIILVGSIKDTRTAALSHLFRDAIPLLKPSNNNLSDFIKINYREIFDYFSDLELFNKLLTKSERSCIFICKREIDKIRDTGIKKEIPYYFPLTFYGFYLKTAKFDAPCRIEFFTDESTAIKKASKKADLISSLILPLSSLNEHYGLPIPQIEAHKRAHFNPHEINLLFNNLTRILHMNGVSLLEKRRNRRPF